MNPGSWLKLSAVLAVVGTSPVLAQEDAGSPAPETAPFVGDISTEQGESSITEVPPVEDGTPVPTETPAPPVAEQAPEPAPTETPAARAVAPEPAPAPVEEPPPAPVEVASSARSEMEFNPRIPRYQQLRPKWGLEIAGSLQALGKTSQIPNLAEEKVQGVSIRFEWQPPMVQKFGVLSLGPSFNVYITPSGVGATSTSTFSLGGQVRYQARYFREQPLVPVVGFAAEYLAYRLPDKSGRFLSTGVFFGGMLLLNFLEPSGAAEFYVNTGVTRSYVVAELRTSSGSDENITLSGSSLFFGLRFEY